jgi:two-component system response regulator HydG
VFEPDAIEALLSHDWPGNVREMRNRIKRAAALSDGETIDVGDLFPKTTLEIAELRKAAAGSLDDAAKAAIRDRVRKALIRTGGNRSEAVRLLGVSRTTIWK